MNHRNSSKINKTLLKSNIFLLFRGFFLIIILFFLSFTYQLRKTLIFWSPTLNLIKLNIFFLNKFLSSLYNFEKKCNKNWMNFDPFLYFSLSVLTMWNSSGLCIAIFGEKRSKKGSDFTHKSPARITFTVFQFLNHSFPFSTSFI